MTSYVKQITPEALVEVLRAVSEETSVILIARTEVRVNKKVAGAVNPLHGRVTRVSEVLGMAGSCYSAAVNSQRTAEGLPADFQALPHNYAVGQPAPSADGEPLGLLKAHRDDPTRLYLPLLVDQTAWSFYEVDGVRAPDQAVEPWLPDRKTPASRQGIDKPVLYRDFKLESILEIALDFDQHYQVQR